MRKFTAVLLSILLLLPLLSGCGAKSKSPVDAYFDLVAEMEGVTEQNFTITMEMKSDAMAGFASSLTLIMEGAASAKNKQLEATLTMTTRSPRRSVELTDIIIDGNELYINAASLFQAAGEMEEGLTAEVELFMNMILGGSDYIMFDLSDFKIWDINLNEHPVLLRLNDVYIKEIKKAQSPLISADNGVYSLEMDGEFMLDLLNVFVDDVDENLDEYVDAVYELLQFISALMEGYMDYLEMFGPLDAGLSELDISKSELRDKLRDGLEDFRDALDDMYSDKYWAEQKYFSSIEKSNDTYTYINETSAEDSTVRLEYVAEKAAVLEIKPPRRYIEINEVIDNLLSMMGLDYMF